MHALHLLQIAMRTMIRAVALVAAMLATASFAQECGEQAGGALCSDCRCCSKWGWCGTGPAYCAEACQSQCDGCGGGGGGGGDEGGGIRSILSKSVFDRMLKHRNDILCPARDFYKYEALVTAANFFPSFATTGNVDTRKREVAAFLAQTAYETAGGWPFAPDGPYAWGYCYKEKVGGALGRDYCDHEASSRWPCAAGKKYYGRGPFQLTWNWNYGPAGEAIYLDLLDDPDVVATDPLVSFLTAVWYWMTPRALISIPSCHDIITGQWIPSVADQEAGRVPGYGAVTNVINGELECGGGAKKNNDLVASRIGFYKRFCDMLGVSYGDNLDCYHQKPFPSGRAIALANNKTTNISNHADA